MRPIGSGRPRALGNPEQSRFKLCRFLALPVVLLAFLASSFDRAAGQSGPSITNVRFDTVVVVGRADEQRPLLLYTRPVPQLVNDSTVSYSDSRAPGRLVTVNLFSGDGWEVLSSSGEEGPGELGGSQPYVSTSRGVIHTVTDQLVYNAWTRDGTLVAHDTHRNGSWHSGSFTTFRAGMMGPRVVVVYAELVGDDQVRQSIRVYDPDLGLIAEVPDAIPGYRVRRVAGAGSSMRTESIDYVPYVIAARGETLVWGLANRENSKLTVLNADGSTRISRELEEPIVGLFMDADERIWAGTADRDVDGNLISIVLDRDLNILFRAGVLFAVDAIGDYVLTFLARDQASGGRAMVLLKMEHVR